MLQYGMRQTAEVINQLTSVERILHYTKLDNEGPFRTPSNKLPPAEWPQKGRVEFKSLYLKYVPTNPPVLNNLNIIIESGDKVCDHNLVIACNIEYFFLDRNCWKNGGGKIITNIGVI